MTERNQGGNAIDYTEFVVEDETGFAPADPEWEPFSDTLINIWDGEPDATTEPLRGLGERDPTGFFNGPESHEYGFQYALQRWYVDASGAVLDPGGAVMTEKDDNSVAQTHTVVTKESHVDGGSADNGRYIFTVGVGGHPSELTIPFETEDGLPVQQTLTYQFEKVREYSISQPGTDETLSVVSSSPEDTTQTLTLENDDGSTAVDLELNGDTAVTTETETFSSLAAAHLDAECEGTVTVSDSSDNVLVEIKGKSDYNYPEGDLGVPATGSGSHAGTVGNDYIRFSDDTITYNGSTAIAPEISSGEAVINNGIEGTTQDGTPRRSYDAGDRESTITASLAGPKVTFDAVSGYLAEKTENIVWSSTVGGTLTFDNAQMMTPGGQVRESEAAKILVEAEWQSEGVTVSDS